MGMPHGDAAWNQPPEEGHGFLHADKPSCQSCKQSYASDVGLGSTVIPIIFDPED